MEFIPKKIEDCFDGSRIFEYTLPREIDEDIIKTLGDLGKLEYFKEFPRPFFRIFTGHEDQIKGVEGEKTFKVIYTRTSLEKGKKEVEATLTSLT